MGRRRLGGFKRLEGALLGQERVCVGLEAGFTLIHCGHEHLDHVESSLFITFDCFNIVCEAFLEVSRFEVDLCGKELNQHKLLVWIVVPIQETIHECSEFGVFVFVKEQANTITVLVDVLNGFHCHLRIFRLVGNGGKGFCETISIFALGCARFQNRIKSIAETFVSSHIVFRVETCSFRNTSL